MAFTFIKEDEVSVSNRGISPAPKAPSAVPAPRQPQAPSVQQAPVSPTIPGKPGQMPAPTTSTRTKPFTSVEPPKTEEVEAETLQTDKPWLRKVGDFFTSSTQAFGKTLGTAAAVATGATGKIENARVQEAEQKLKLASLLSRSDISDEQKTRIRNMIVQPSVVTSAVDAIPELNKTGKQVFGEAIGVGLEALSGGGLEAVGKGIVKKEGAKAVIKASAKVGGVYGGLGSTAEAMKEDESLSEILKAGTFGTAVGVGLGTAIPLAGVVAGKAAKESSGLVRGIYRTFKPTVITDLQSAIKPATKKADKFAGDLAVTIEHLGDKSGNITNLRDLDRELGNAKKELWSKISSKIEGAAERGVVVNDVAEGGTSPLYASIMQNADNPVLIRENPEAIERLKVKAQAYNMPIGIDEAENLLEIKNAELKAYYQLNKTDRATVLKTNPEKAADIAIADTLRQMIDDKLETVSGEGVAEFKRIYGALSSVKGEVLNRIPVSERQNMTSLAEQISLARTMGNFAKGLLTFKPSEAFGSLFDYASASYLKQMETSDAKIQRAFKNVIKEQQKEASEAKGLKKLLDKAPKE